MTDSDVCSDARGCYPSDLTQYASVPDPAVTLNSLLKEERVPSVTQHIIHDDTSEALCGETLDADADRYPFRGQRSQIIAGMHQLCSECVTELQTGPRVMADGGSDVSSDDTGQIEVEEWRCPHCGWLEPEYQAGDPALCPNCGVEYPRDKNQRVRKWPRCAGWNDDGSKCDRQTTGEYCHDHDVEPGTGRSGGDDR